MKNEIIAELQKQAQDQSALNKVELGKKLKKRREMLGISLEELANDLEIPLAKLQEIERMAEE